MSPGGSILANFRPARRGLMFVVSSPSGAGKTTLCNRLLQADPNLVLSISTTTRQKRAGEIDGQDYFFVEEDEFIAMRDKSAFLEWARVFDHFYGTPQAPVAAALEAGRDILFDIDWQGAQQLAQVARDDLVKVFILPPSRAELYRRLQGRAQDSAEIVARRMSKANNEISHWAEYDYVVINQDLQAAEAEMRSILAAERLKRRRQTGLSDFVKALTEKA